MSETFKNIRRGLLFIWKVKNYFRCFYSKCINVQENIFTVHLLFTLFLFYQDLQLLLLHFSYNHQEHQLRWSNTRNFNFSLTIFPFCETRYIINEQLDIYRAFNHEGLLRPQVSTKDVCFDFPTKYNHSVHRKIISYIKIREIIGYNYALTFSIKNKEDFDGIKPNRETYCVIRSFHITNMCTYLFMQELFGLDTFLQE